MNQPSVEEMLWDREEYCDTAIYTETFYTGTNIEAV